MLVGIKTNDKLTPLFACVIILKQLFASESVYIDTILLAFFTMCILKFRLSAEAFSKFLRFVRVFCS